MSEPSIENLLAGLTDQLAGEKQLTAALTARCEALQAIVDGHMNALDQQRIFFEARCEALTAERDKWKARTESLANFNPNWDLLEATQKSLREHMKTIKELNAENEELKGRIANALL